MWKCHQCLFKSVGDSYARCINSFWRYWFPVGLQLKARIFQCIFILFLMPPLHVYRYTFIIFFLYRLLWAYVPKEILPTTITTKPWVYFLFLLFFVFTSVVSCAARFGFQWTLFLLKTLLEKKECPHVCFFFVCVCVWTSEKIEASSPAEAVCMQFFVLAERCKKY